MRTMTHKQTLLRLGLLLAGLLLIAGSAAGCGESDADKAQTKVCDARADLNKQVDNLAALTPSTATADGVQKNLDAIESDLKKMKDAQADLSDDRKQEVESATKEFGSEVESIASGLQSDLSASGAKSKLQAAGQELQSSYKKAFSQVQCD